MAWTTPRTWVAAEVVTASVMNTHVRDNLAYLKGILDGTVAGNVTVTGNVTASGTVTGTTGGAFGALSASLNTTLLGDLSVDGDLTFSGTVLLAGASGPQALAFLGDPDTGISNPTANELLIQAGGSDSATFAGTYVSISQPLVAQDNITGMGILTVTPLGGGGNSSGIDNSGNLYTEAGGLNVVGNSVLTGTLTVGGRTISSAGVRAYHNANQSIATGTPTVLALNSERSDTDSFHNVAVNNSRLTVPAGKGGVYVISGNVEFAANATGVREVRIVVGGAASLARQTVLAATGGVTTSLSVVTATTLNAADYIELAVLQTSGGSLDVTATSYYSAEFAMHLIG